MWRLWAKALGEKHGRTDSEADKIALIRTIIVVCRQDNNFYMIESNRCALCNLRALLVWLVQPLFRLLPLWPR